MFYIIAAVDLRRAVVFQKNFKTWARQAIEALTRGAVVLFLVGLVGTMRGQQALPAAVEPQVRAGVEALKAGDLETANRIFENALRRGVRHPLILHNLGVIAQQRGNYALAVERFRQALALQPNYGPSRLLLGSSLLALGKKIEAVRELRRATSLMPQEPASHLELAKALEASDDWIGAVEQFRQLTKLAPQNAEYSYQLSAALTKLSGWALLEISRDNPDAARLHQALAQDYAVQGNYLEALDAYRKAARSDPHLPEIHLGMALILLELRRFDEAMKEVNLELNLVPNSKTAADTKARIEAAASHSAPSADQ